MLILLPSGSVCGEVSNVGDTEEGDTGNDDTGGVSNVGDISNVGKGFTVLSLLR